MSANKKDELLKSLTRKDAQKPPMDVTYENKGLVLGQITDRPSDEQLTPQTNTTNVSDSSVVEMNLVHERQTSNKQMNTAHGDGTNIVNNNAINETETSNVQINTTQEQETIKEYMSSTHVDDTEHVHIKSTHEITTTRILQSFKESIKRETVEDTHTRKTFIVRNDLLRELDKLSKKQGRGFQTWFVNMAFERLLEELRGSQTKR